MEKLKLLIECCFTQVQKLSIVRMTKKGVKDNITDIKANANRGNKMTIEELTKNDKRNIEK
jgi:hypothetical protein